MTCTLENWIKKQYLCKDLRHQEGILSVARHGIFAACCDCEPCMTAHQS